MTPENADCNENHAWRRRLNISARVGKMMSRGADNHILSGPVSTWCERPGTWLELLQRSLNTWSNRPNVLAIDPRSGIPVPQPHSAASAGRREQVGPSRAVRLTSAPSMLANDRSADPAAARGR